MNILHATEAGIRDYNTLMFYTAATVVLAPVAGLTAAAADVTFAVAAHLSGSEEAKQIASARFWHIPSSLVCAIPGVATIGLIYLTRAEWLISNGRSINAAGFVHCLS